MEWIAAGDNVRNRNAGDGYGAEHSVPDAGNCDGDSPIRRCDIEQRHIYD